MNKIYIQIKGVSKEYNENEKKINVLSDISLDIDEGEFICFLGPSGCGKTTLLNIIAGFEKPTKGEVYIDGKNVQAASSSNIMIFQNHGLLPWRTVRGNVLLGLESKKADKKKNLEIADKYIDMVGLSDFKKYHPYQLSGGMQQRAAIARALAMEPKILFMDEPFNSLDYVTKIRMQDEICDIWKSNQRNIILVTHDIDEAAYLADKVVIMDSMPGVIRSIIEIGLPRKRDRASAEFLQVRDKIFLEFTEKVCNNLNKGNLIS